jgi:endogenous inhibitor of DNA gyrase (YacG/DUF329 family)
MRQKPDVSQIIGVTDCPSCGRRIALKTDKNGKAYFFCAHVCLTRDSGKCGVGRKMSHLETQRLEVAYVNSQSGAAQVYTEKGLRQILTGKQDGKSHGKIQKSANENRQPNGDGWGILEA